MELSPAGSGLDYLGFDSEKVSAGFSHFPPTSASTIKRQTADKALLSKFSAESNVQGVPTGQFTVQSALLLVLSLGLWGNVSAAPEQV